MRISQLFVIVALCLSGCPAKESERRAAPRGKPTPAVSESSPQGAASPLPLAHVAKGQLYRFKGEQAGVSLEDIYRVTAFRSDIPQVEYEHTASVSPPGAEPMASQRRVGVWGVPADWKEPSASSLEKVKAAGRTWTCVAVKEGPTTTYVPVQAGRPIWPLFVKQTGPNSTKILVSIE